MDINLVHAMALFNNPFQLYKNAKNLFDTNEKWVNMRKMLMVI